MSVLRYLLLGAASALASIGSMLVTVSWGGGGVETGVKDGTLGLELLKLEPVSVPVVRQGAVEGYVIARVSIAATSLDIKNNKTFISAYGAEAVFRAIHEESGFNFTAIKPIQAATLSDRIPGLANLRAGRSIIHQAVIEGLNYVSAQESRGEGAR